MRIAVLGSTGGTGRQLLTQALDRGHTVVALVRDPSRLASPPSSSLEVVTGDVHDPSRVARALSDVDVVVSGLGAVRKGRPGTLTAGATALVGGPRVVWLTALGSGSSAAAAGPLTRLLLPVVLGRAELADKARAEELLLPTGAAVFAAGPLTDGVLSGDRRTVALAAAPRRLFPASVSRATVAAAMLDEAEQPLFTGQVAVPLG
ncbi:NAD(P)-dependent oxidoreductase [uncultured Modestobacter sp.]|uniref:NAD(P)-dependent oxidoreductase n=1 Tax=uncultured Modestobacter sp. TaxID=380048 RepID=UPI002614CC7D|nr:NAD(P)H-binding protein [uncultured Modestobacter sp.]